jgi:hypothetical protein
MSVRRARCAALCLALFACAALAQPKPRPVAPGHLFKGDYLNVKAPDSGGWHLLGSGSGGMAFAKQGLSPVESLAASVLMFPLAPAQTPEEFVEMIKQGLQKDTNWQRFDPVAELRAEYSAERPYPCVRVHQLLVDKQAQTSPKETRVLQLEIHALYCRHPVKTETGFAALYSYRGYGSYPHFADSAREFIQGVEVPSPAPGK